LQAASACALSAAGIGEALITSTHTSFAAARAPERLPLAALLQIPSALLFTLEDSVGACSTTDLHSATAAASVAALTGLPGVVLGVDVDGVELVAAAAGVLDVVDVVAVEPLVVELPLLPQPAMSAPQSNAPTSSGDRFPNICFPLVFEKRLLAAGQPAMGAWLWQG
jgi:hypothetical protein